MNEDAQAELARLRAENATLRSKNTKSSAIRMGTKGNVCVYGLQRWPVSLYASQWERLAELMPEVLEFIKTHETEVTRKATVKDGEEFSA